MASVQDDVRGISEDDGRHSVERVMGDRVHDGSGENVCIEPRDIDREEEHRVAEFCSEGCRCSKKCSSLFSLEYFREARANTAQLDHAALYMVVMGQVMAFTNRSRNTLHSSKHCHPYKEREKNNTTFYHQGLRVCRKTFLFLHNIGEFRFKAIKAHCLSEGLVARTHGHAGRVAPNSLMLEEVKDIILFVLQYVEVNGILLPGRIPGYKRDDIKLLPSSTTKKAVWSLYQDNADVSGSQPVAYSTFCQVWKKFLGHVVVCKPMTDLCATCQRNSAAIIRSANMTEYEKSEVCVNMRNYSMHTKFKL